MAIAQKVAGFSLGKADLLRRAMGKKKKSELDKQFDVLRARHERQRLLAPRRSRRSGTSCCPFSDYAFNKAHTAAYGLVSYWTAYLKANYPAEYMAALLTSVKDDKDKSALYLNECRRMGIKVLPPDVNESDADFTPRRHRHPLRPVGDPQRRRQRGRRRSSPRARRRAASPTSRTSCARSRRRLQQAGHRVADQGGGVRLARARAQGPGRWCTSRPSTRSSTIKRNEAIGQDSLFGGVEDGRGPDLRRADPRRGVGQEHPARRSSARCSASTSPTTRCSASSTSSPPAPTARSPRSRTTSRPDGQIVTVGGILSGVAAQGHQEGRHLGARRPLEDLEGAIEVMFFPSAYQLCSTVLAEDAVVFVNGRLDKREDVGQDHRHGGDRCPT